MDNTEVKTLDLTGGALEWAMTQVRLEADQPKTFACHHNMPTCEYCRWMVMRWLAEELGETIQVPTRLLAHDRH